MKIWGLQVSKNIIFMLFIMYRLLRESSLYKWSRRKKKQCCVSVCRPAVWGWLAPGWRGLPEDQLQQRELWQCPALLQKPWRKYCFFVDRQTGQFCSGRATKVSATRQGGWLSCSKFRNDRHANNVSDRYSLFSTCMPYKIAVAVYAPLYVGGRRYKSNF